MSFADFSTADRRLTILRGLAASSGYRAAQFLLRRYCEQFGHSASQDQIRTDLAWLREQGLIQLEEPDGVFVATLTGRGGDVAGGLATVPGVARPQPGG